MSFEQQNSFEEPTNREELEKDDNESFDRIVGTPEYQQAEQYWRDHFDDKDDLDVENNDADNSQNPEPRLTDSNEKNKTTKENKKLVPQESQEKINNVFKEIETNLKNQPESVQKLYQEKRGEFKTFATVNGKDFIFTDKNNDELISLVRDSEFPNKWKTRAFRISGSDHQWKSLPGLRSDGHSYMKGEEDNLLHHYVQSAKLDKNMYQIISSLPEGYIRTEEAKKYLPIKNKRFEDEFEFKEEYIELKNKEWRYQQGGLQWFFDRFMILNKEKKQLGLDSDFYKMLKKDSEGNRSLKKVVDAIEELNQDPVAKKDIADWNEKVPGFMADLTYFINEEYSDCYKKFIKKYQEGLNDFVEWGFAHPFPKGMIPDFSKEKMVDSYKKNNIDIEEYEVKSPEGDDLIFAMARDEKGRIYIDNIYDPRVGMNDYGIPNQICQMGHLVYKPEEYKDYAFGIPEKYKKPGSEGQYTDISALWEKSPIIKNFKEELIKRGVIAS